MSCEALKKSWKGQYDFNKQIRIGKGVVVEEGKEYFVEYKPNGEEIKNSKRRTFEGIRLMIIGNRLFYFIIIFYF